MTLEEKIEQEVSDILKAKGYGVVKISFEGGKYKNLRFFLENLDESPFTLKDCQTATRLINPILDVKDFIDDKYTLEVSSPGIDRPLVKWDDFVRFSGNQVQISTHIPINDRKKFKGMLKNSKEEDILLEIPGDSPETVTISFENIKAARLAPEIVF